MPATPVPSAKQARIKRFGEGLLAPFLRQGAALQT